MASKGKKQKDKVVSVNDGSTAEGDDEIKGHKDEKTEEGKESAENTSENPENDSKIDKTEIGKLKEKINELENKNIELEKANNELKNDYLRKVADFDNFRKRMFKEKEEAIKYSNSVLITDLVDVIDNFERAIKSANASTDFTSFHSGIMLIEKHMVSMLESKWGLKRFDSLGEEFDPEKHEAIGMEESAETEKPCIKEVYQNGYTLHGRVIRHAKVKVVKPLSQEKNSDNVSEVNNN